MEKMLLLFFSLIVFGTACAQAPQESTESITQERDLELDAPFLDQSYDIFAVQKLAMPLAKHAYLLARQGDKEIVIREASEFSQVVTEIVSPEDALELARLLISHDIRPFLLDIYYSEVHKYVEPENKDDIVEPWFALSPEQYDAWNVREPIVTRQEDGRYKIERFVASYPRKKDENDELTPPQLLKIWEWIDAEGHYSMEIQDVVTEDKAIYNILLFTK
ncbi:hypothetical protein CSA56_15635 [candidate division KSB3 bacterium]|uniref:Uncharacterized protein n=1 Tax=candidate division KSB3 bacterium TaxID=2044937 RepID=A0A2G6K9R3_9BACT|nr:MAG: hypothetical protein CSA56_15635 [candidate division KSB3 bacterium]